MHIFFVLSLQVLVAEIKAGGYPDTLDQIKIQADNQASAIGQRRNIKVNSIAFIK